MQGGDLAGHLAADTPSTPPGHQEERGGGHCHVPVDGGTRANQSSTGCHTLHRGDPGCPHCPAEMLCLKHLSAGRGKHSWLGMRCGGKEEKDSGKLSGPASQSSWAVCPFPALAPLAVVLSLLGISLDRSSRSMKPPTHGRGQLTHVYVLGHTATQHPSS